MDGTIDFDRLPQFTAAIARALLGEPTKATKTELRYRTHGSLSIDIAKASYFDHEASEGGGICQLIEKETGKPGPEWIAAHFPALVKPNGSDPVVATYVYQDADGTELMRKPRTRRKNFWLEHPDGRGGWTKGIKGIKRVPYRLPELTEAIAQERMVFVCEGEKDVDNLRHLGVVATCNVSGGASETKWPDDKIDHYFAGADVVVIPDNDPQSRDKNGALVFHPDGRPQFCGQDHAHAACAGIAKVAKRVRYLDLITDWPALPKKGDVSDWIAHGGTIERLYEIAEQAPDWSPELPRPQAEDAEARPGLDCEPWWRDPKTIPRRAFLSPDKHYARKYIGASIGGGGRLKTSYGLFEAVEMAHGRSLTTRDDLPAGPLRALCLNAEEDQDELDRRVAAICLHYNISQSDLGRRLFVKSVRDRPMRFATLVRGVPTLNADALDQLTDFIRRERIDVFMLDPWVSFHAVRESENSDMDLVIKQGLGSIASATNSAGEIFHHPGKPKPGGQDTTVEDARGASAIIWAVRSARVFNYMTLDEAARVGVADDERRRHIRVANGKANMAGAGKAEWLRIELENLPNGDEVACATLWKPQNPFDGLTEDDPQRGALLAQGGAYRNSVQSPQWYGWKLAEMLGVPIAYGGDNDARDLARIKAIIKTWLKNKVLKVVARKDVGQRKEKDYIVPGPAADLGKAGRKDQAGSDDLGF